MNKEFQIEEAKRTMNLLQELSKRIGYAFEFNAEEGCNLDIILNHKTFKITARKVGNQIIKKMKDKKELSLIQKVIRNLFISVIGIWLIYLIILGIKHLIELF